uniref:non-specific lipid transfer protein GPI-anchored 16-like n=1 Tax=Erigeron canadensis TaxID=72917 RepID=UPI001CB9C61F|nr:non-specific lipid transfer protein GPI-anchored 16-like [Erigeron canadensis]
MDASTFFLATLLTVVATTVNGQITTPCTMSMVAGFTPCVNYLTGSVANGKSPSVNCCDAMESLMSTSMDCTCLIVTGGVPFSLPSPINQALANSLLQSCNSKSMPLQCKASGFTLPPPGPMLFAPPPPPKAFAPTAYSPEFPPGASVSEIMVARPHLQMTHDVSIDMPARLADPRSTSGIRSVIATSNSISISSSTLVLVVIAATAIQL